MLTCFTRDMGKIQGLVKGVRGARAAVPWYLEPLTLQHLVVYERRRSPWALIGASDLIDGFAPLRRDLERTAYALLFLDLADAMTEVKDPHPELFDLLLVCLRALEKGGEPRATTRFFEARLLRICGHLAEPGALALSEGSRAALRRLLEAPLSAAGTVALSAPEEMEIRRLLNGLFHRVLERELKTRMFLYSVGLDKAA